MTTQAWLVIVTMSVVTVALRATPFVARRAVGESDYLAHLARVMPVGVMALLVAYSLKDVTSSPWGAVQVGLAAIAAVLYWRTGRLLASMLLPLVAHVVIASSGWL